MAPLSLIEQIRRRYSVFSQSERQVADYICDHLPQVSRMSIRELKDAAGVSSPTVFRFCKTMGFGGYKDFKISLAEQTPTFKDYFTIEPPNGENSIESLVRRLLLSERDAIDATLRMLDFPRLHQAADMMIGAKRIFLFGVSTSFDICCDLQRKLSRLGLNVWCGSDGHDATSHLACFSAQDLLMCISQSGATKETVTIAKYACSAHIPVLSITASSTSAIAPYSSLILHTFSPEITGNRVGITTRTAQHALVDALYMTVAGSIGENVAQLMERSLLPLLHR
ncbi:MAG: MurR/RpiR family transcriptional regulator [Clostridiales bacterium]|nr:MurR/RpiR family transcriptional regulator [Clostridiales bacterium]